MIANMPYPRLEIAVADQHDEFVGHDYCQQILRQKWLTSDVTGEIIPWHSSKLYEKIIYSLCCIPFSVLAIPIYIIGVLFCGGYTNTQEKAKQEQTYPDFDTEQNSLCCGLNTLRRAYYHFSFPINRFIAHTMSHFFFLIILVINSENPNDDDEKLTRTGMTML